MIKVGDKLKVYISFGAEYKFRDEAPQEGTVVYVHPKRRFCVVEFRRPVEYDDRRFRESYFLDSRMPKAHKESVGTHSGNARGIYFRDLRDERKEDERRKQHEHYIDHKS